MTKHSLPVFKNQVKVTRPIVFYFQLSSSHMPLNIIIIYRHYETFSERVMTSTDASNSLHILPLPFLLFNSVDIYIMRV